MTTPTPRTEHTAADRFPRLFAIAANYFGEIERAITNAHPAATCLPLPDFSTLHPATLADLDPMIDTLASNLHGDNSGVSDTWLAAYDACPHLARKSLTDIYDLVHTYAGLLSSIRTECREPRTWRNEVNSATENAIRRLRNFKTNVLAVTDMDKQLIRTKAEVDTARLNYTAPLGQLTTHDDVLSADMSAEYPDADAETVVAACAASRALDRGWEPNPADAHGFDRERAQYNVEVITSLDQNRMDRMITLGHSAIEWLNANNHVTSHATAVLDESGFRIEFRPLTADDSVLTRTYAEAQPNLDALTMVNTRVAEMGVARGWEPPIDGPGLDFFTGEQVADYLGQLDESGPEHGDEPIARVAAYVVPWLIANGHIAPGHLALLNDDGFLIVPAATQDKQDALRASSFDGATGWTRDDMVQLTPDVYGLRYDTAHPEGNTPESYQIFHTALAGDDLSDETAGATIALASDGGWNSFGPRDADTGHEYQKHHDTFADAILYVAVELDQWANETD